VSTNPNWDAFETTLATQFETLFASDPAYQRVKATHTPAQYAAKITLALADGSADKSGEGVQRTCQVLGIKHTYKAIKAYLTGDAPEPEEKTMLVATGEGTKIRVKLYVTFDREIAGQKFRLCVTEATDTVGKVITHKNSGLKVCRLAVGASYLPAFAHLATDRARADCALDELIERVGAAKVRSVMAAQESSDSDARVTVQS
jgi:hypothetical protein